MRIADRVMFGNNPILFILLYPLMLIFRFIGWIRNPNRFCKHEWEERKLEKTYGVFGGMEVYKCKKCGKEDWERNATKRLERSGLL